MQIFAVRRCNTEIRISRAWFLSPNWPWPQTQHGKLRVPLPFFNRSSLMSQIRDHSHPGQLLGMRDTSKTDEFSEKFRGWGGGVRSFSIQNADFGNFKQGPLIMKVIQNSNFRVCFFNNYIEKNQNKTHSEEGTSESPLWNFSEN